MAMNKNNISYKNKSDLFIFLGPILVGFSIFSVLSFLLISLRINIPISIIMTFLTFWLTKYFFSDSYHDNDTDLINETSINVSNKNQLKSGTNYSNFLFFIIYCSFLAITSATTYDPSIFLPWSEFSFADTVKLASAVGLSFFMPGYAIVNIISRNNKLEKILKYLSAYLFSALITGLCAYVTATFGIAVVDNKNIILLVYLAILILHTALNYRKIFNKNILNFSYGRSLSNRVMSLSGNTAVMMVFIALFSMQIIQTYYLFNATIIGDQWYHHGKSLSFVDGAFKDIESTAPRYYPPLFSALISEFLVLSGNASVNAFVSINFLIMPAILSFYFFAKKWMPIGAKKSALLATTLFTLGSGFGWIYVLQLATSQPLSSDATILEIFRIATIKSFDLNLANTFFATPHPSPHGSIALPAGFLLLGLLKLEMKSRLKYALIFAITIVGIMSHDEFYLFILISSALLLIYHLNKTHIIFIALLSSIVFVFFVDIFLPLKYYKLPEISGIPLMLLSFVFVLAAWALHIASTLHLLKGIKIKIHQKFTYERHTGFIISSVIVSVILYLYFFTFIVWNDLSVEQVSIQTDNYGQRDIPWYLFPMKLGVVGFFGLLFILSYLYKKFQRETFVFAVIAIFAFLAAPYYDEYRFGKYIMVGMIGFASLLIYRIICYLQTLRMNMLVVGLFLGIVIATTSLSLLMYTGFKDILIGNPGYRLIPGENNRFFPTNSEMNFFSTLKNEIVDFKTDNIAVLRKDYGTGLLSEKLMGFVGIPGQKIYHNPLILNASSLAALYQYLESDDIRYIIISQDDLKETIKQTNPTKFAIDSFPRIYEDDNYLVLKVPSLVGPNPNPEVALVYDPTDQIPIWQAYSYLQYNKSSYTPNEAEHVQIKENGNLILLNNETDPTTIWTNLVDEKINLIEFDFKILQENKPKNKVEIEWKNDTSFYQQEVSSQHPNNNLGLKWIDDRKEYSLLLTAAGLELSTKAINGTHLSALQNQEIFKEPGKWYNVKILLLKKEIIIFVNGLSRFQIDREENNTDSIISKMEIVAHGNNAEFLPIKVKQISDFENLYYSNSKSINYILSFLAMSKSSYGLFLQPDLSVISKTIILPFDPTNMNSDKFNRYLEYVRKGGTLIVFNSGNTVDGIFAKFFSINSTGAELNFSKITYSDDNQQNDIAISGKAGVLKIPPENGPKTVSFYSDESNGNITPFAIEMKSPNGGKLIFVNNGGFFDSISNSNNEFLNLANISKLLNINFNDNISQTNLNKFESEDRFTKLQKFVGLMELQGKINISSSSVMLSNGRDGEENLNHDVEKLVLSNNTKKISFDNVTIKELKLYGHYKALLNFSGSISLPSSNSYYDYIDLHVPIESPVRIKVVPGEYGGASISIINQSKVNTFNFADNFEIDILKGSNNSSNGLLDFLIKNPEIDFTGSAIIDSPDFYDVLLSGSRYLKINGTISAQFDHVDDYYEKRDGLLESRYITYLKNISITGKTSPYTESIGIMGDISYRARNQGVDIPIQEIFMSTPNVILIVSLFIGCFFVCRLMWSRRFVSRI
jgi:hypothetical protein